MDAASERIAHNSQGGGMQSIVIAISGGPHSGEYIAFSLPAVE